MKCPNCGSDNCFPITETNTKGFDAGNACCGYFLLGGPLGLLCGLCGTGETKTKQYWKCGNCGSSFK